MNVAAELQDLCTIARSIHAVSRNPGHTPADMGTAILAVHTMADTLHYRLERLARELGVNRVEQGQAEAVATPLRRH